TRRTVSLVTSCSCVRVYPIAFLLAQVARPRTLPMLLLLLLIPFCVNELLRTFALFVILSLNGPLNVVLLWLGVLAEPVRFVGTDGAVIVGMGYAYVLLLVCPLSNPLETVERAQVGAARDV